MWEAAEQADLVTLDPHGEKVLDNNFEIKPCEATADELIGPGQDIVIPHARDDESATKNSSTQPTPQAPFKTTAKSST
ncbi:conserved hypothetical protein [Bradyrhizobium sp. STM 3809]|nr:conserved hypothetical protein [Bradyrhizobium sp. STM 3809]